MEERGSYNAASQPTDDTSTNSPATEREPCLLSRENLTRDELSYVRILREAQATGKGVMHLPPFGVAASNAEWIVFAPNAAMERFHKVYSSPDA